MPPERHPAAKGRAVDRSSTTARAIAADPGRGAAASRPVSRHEPRWSDTASAVPDNVSMLRRALVAFAADCGADAHTQGSVALAASEAITNAVVHAFTGLTPGTVSVDAVFREARLRVTIADDGLGMHPRPDSPGLGLGLPTIANVAARVSIGPGAGGRGTEVAFEFPLP